MIIRRTLGQAALPVLAALGLLTFVAAPAARAHAAQVTDTAAAPAAPVTDGPYITWHGDTLVQVRAVCSDRLVNETVRIRNGAAVVPNPCDHKVFHTLSSGAPVADTVGEWKAPRVFSVSDVEGKYDDFLALLRAAGVVNGEGKWSYGDGHLVLVGDLVDRGEHVTEVLWAVHRLEREAESAGGRVHYVLGNHEVMLLMGDDRYVHEKYKRVQAKLGEPMAALYGPTTELGRWLRSKPTMVRVNDELYVHAGISRPWSQKAKGIAHMNAIVRKSLLDPELMVSDPLTNLTIGTDGPMWYRGYFGGDTAAMSTAGLDSALSRFGAKRVVIGHTPVIDLVQLFDGRVVAIDVTFTRRENIAGLLVEGGKLTRIGIDGQKAPLY